MSEDEDTTRSVVTKRRRLQGACDGCRKRKIKCDSAKMPDNICSNCIAFQCECTHLLATIKRKRGPPIGKPRGTRAIRTIVSAILSETTPFTVPDNQEAVLQLLVDLATHITTLETELDELRITKTSVPESSSTTNLSDSASFPTTSGLSRDQYDADSPEGISENLENLALDQSRHFGASSSLTLVKTAMDIKGELPQDAQLPSSLSSRYLKCRRPEFWAIYPWQLPIEDKPPPLEFPEEDLLRDLIKLYFLNCGQFIPVLHRPTFERSIAQGLHYSNRQFGYTLLAVCAVASRYSNDARVFVKGASQEFSAGWHWFRQIRLLRNSYITIPTIYEVQLCILAIVFVQGSSTPEACWILVAHGIRLAQDVGAHRRKTSDKKPTIEDELWKRAFWLLLIMDIYVSAFAGRPRATTADDFDLDLPIECDDEYWENSDPSLAFKQPLGRPARMIHCISLLKLMDIFSMAQRTIYPTRRVDTWTVMGFSDSEWNQKILSEVDSSLNNWIDNIPEHLKWDPNREDIDFFNQSVLLYLSYYWVQILVHKPFITRPNADSDLSFPSLAICVNAARSAIHVMEVQQRRGFLPLPNVVITLYNSAIILVLNAWRGKHFGISSATNKELNDIHKCIGLIRTYERRWQSCGVYIDVIRELLVISDLYERSPLSFDEAQSQDRDSALAFSRPQDSMPTFDIAPLDFQIQNAPSYPDMDPNFTLPLHSNELGNLPLHQTFDTFGDTSSFAYADVPIQQIHPHPGGPSYHDSSNEFGNISSGVVPSDIVNLGFPGLPTSDWDIYLSNVDELLNTMNTTYHDM